jgi:hypothetical protein
VDLVIDIQCFHIFSSPEERRRVADLMCRYGPDQSGCGYVRMCVCVSVCVCVSLSVCVCSN